MSNEVNNRYLDLLAAIREENLNVYRASPQRLSEDIGQEDQIATDYRGRLVYELLQNADDAMVDNSGEATTISFFLTDKELWVANSGRPLTEADIRGLCGISASSKTGIVGKKRATIGHKGMGFKSVLEITDTPEVYSTSVSFRFSQVEALKELSVLVAAGNVQNATKAPISRFPKELADDNKIWQGFVGNNMKTGFRFPFKKALSQQQIKSLENALIDFPVTSLIFLKHVSRVKVQIDRSDSQHRHAWTVSRQQSANDGWFDVNGYTTSGIYRIELDSDSGANETFLMAHNTDIPIGNNRGGLAGHSWEGVDVTEVSVAVALENGLPIPIADERKKFHVFLPTGEACPFNMLVNGAFSCNLSRQEIRVEEGGDNYNRLLFKQAALLFCNHLLPALKQQGADIASTIGLLKRKQPPLAKCITNAAQCFYESIRDALNNYAFIPLESGVLKAISDIVVPPPVQNNETGRCFREVLCFNATFDGYYFPIAELCATPLADVLVDLGAYSLEAEEVAQSLANAAPERSKLYFHPSDKYWVDPVLAVLEKICQGTQLNFRQELALAVRKLPLFPVSLKDDDSVVRVVTANLTCFYPPRTLRGSVPLVGLQFMMQELCWGDLTPKERNLYLKNELPIWQELFDVREFKFPEVMRASVLPSLDLERVDSNREHDNQESPTLDRLAAICQLSGRTPNRDAPLPFERLGTNRALFNLSRLDLPCRGEHENEIIWVPAYKVYFGSDWIGECSIELVLHAVREKNPENVPGIHFLLNPEKFTGLLERYSHLEAIANDSEAESDEVSLDEDEDAPLDDNTKSRWLEFFQWLGVNKVLRPVHFHDVEERAAGWLKTSELRKPESWIFQHVRPELWKGFVTSVRGRLEKNKERYTETVPYFYRLHDLEHLVMLLQRAESDASASVAKALFEHLALNWSVLEKFSKVKIAQVPRDQVPGMRTKPVRAREEELCEAGYDFWAYRLRGSSFCPTGHGPRRPNQVWLPTPEVKRRFGRRGMEQTGYLIPTLEVSPSILNGKGHSFALMLGLRPEMGSESFTVEDAHILLARIADIYKDRFAAGESPIRYLREVIRPAYRELIELLSGRERGKNPDGIHSLAQAPVLAHDGKQQYLFMPAEKALYLERRDTRERLHSDIPIWCFVLEAFPAAMAPLSQMFGMRTLEDSLHWEPSQGETSLTVESVIDFRGKLRELAPYLLARIGVERADDRAARLDSKLMRQFIEVVDPITTLELLCRLDGNEMQSGMIKRESFVFMKDGNVCRALLVWGENPWPPTPEDAENLATALCEIYGASYFEPFLALISSTTNQARKKLLRRAGAPLDLDSDWMNTEDDSTEETEQANSDDSLDLKTIPTKSDNKKEATPQGPNSKNPHSEDEKQRIPLYAPGQISINGTPVALTGIRNNGTYDAAADRRGDGNKTGNSSGGYGGNTNLDELDKLGMYVSMSFERTRLHAFGLTTAEIFDCSCEEQQPHALVFDVSSPECIERARKYSLVFDATMARLKSDHQISCEWPGFDILTINPQLAHKFDRLIELKSSGVSARTQGMSWNEWKCAQNSKLRSQFYLYLVGNLRSDLLGAKPFIRTIKNPFEQMEAKVIEERVLRQTIQLSVNCFENADHLDLTVTS